MAVPTASSSAYLDGATVGRLEALKQSLQADQRPAAPQPAADQRKNARSGIGASLTPRKRRLYWLSGQIKHRYEDGVALNGADAAFMLRLLHQHPRSAAKVGAGVRAIVVGRFISGSRCFFVVRTDGTCEDFSVPRCLGVKRTRSPRIAAAMAAFRYELIHRMYQLRTATARRVVQAGTEGPGE
ncbi:DCL family protein [Streptomyces gibsoniae]|uniref:DCL family protein n=1 Tax=Streptomyces gibsoniae TaxID=3075529 RepID=A0ABU2U8Y1_9ACTN|nr:DCL family protein [Streptomyces sp. DSM 41699]MDT0469688.1 DCL family protein [Streptomyces sp. DSM 41699]